MVSFQSSLLPSGFLGTSMRYFYQQNQSNLPYHNFFQDFFISQSILYPYSLPFQSYRSQALFNISRSAKIRWGCIFWPSLNSNLQIYQATISQCGQLEGTRLKKTVLNIKSQNFNKANYLLDQVKCSYKMFERCQTQQTVQPRIFP